MASSDAQNPAGHRLTRRGFVKTVGASGALSVVVPTLLAPLTSAAPAGRARQAVTVRSAAPNDHTMARPIVLVMALPGRITSTAVILQRMAAIASLFRFAISRALPVGEIYAKSWQFPSPTFRIAT